MVHSRRVMVARARPRASSSRGEAFDVGAADGEQGKRPGAAPASELAQVQRVRFAGQAAAPGQEPGEGEPFGIGEGGLNRGERDGWGVAVVIGHLPAGLETGRLGQCRSQQ
jgi:hypothetical protein